MKIRTMTALALLAACASAAEMPKTKELRTATLHVQMDLHKGQMDLDAFYDWMKRTGADAVQVAPHLRLDAPTPEARKAVMDNLARVLAFFQAKKVPTTVWSNTLGYGGSLPKHLADRFAGSVRVCNAKGPVASDTFCPTDEAMFRQILQNARDFAAAGATAIQWDDDLFSSRGAPCCVCPNHLARIAKILGRRVTAEEAEKAFFGKPNDVRRAVLQASGEAMMDFARKLRKGLDETAPNVDMTFCLSNPLWDIEGLDVFAFAEALQAKGTKIKFFRVSGASYWPFLEWGSRYPGMDLGSVMDFVRVQSAWVRNCPDVVAIDENDTYPRSTKDVPAWAFSFYDKLVAADGGLRRNPYMLRTDPNGFDPAYVMLFEREKADADKLASLFRHTDSYGVRVIYPMRQIADADVAAGRQNLEALYSMPVAADFLSRMGVPVKFDGADDEGPVAAFDSVAERLLPSERMRGVFTDRRGAQLLEARGTDTGVKKMPADAPCFCYRNQKGERFAIFNCELKDYDFTKPADPAMRAATAKALAFFGSAKMLRATSDARVYQMFARNPRTGAMAVFLANLSGREAEVTIEADGPARIRNVPQRAAFETTSAGARVKLAAHGWAAACLRVPRPTVGAVRRGAYTGAASRVKPKHVVFVGFDGLTGCCLPTADAPRMRRMMETGAWTLASRTILPSSSSCSWHSLFTCSASEQHGFITWNTQVPVFGPTALDENGFYPDVFGELRRARPDAEIGFVYDWDGMGFTADTNACNWARNVPLKEITPAACRYIREKKPNFLAVVYDCPDGAGHSKGWRSAPYMKDVKMLDGFLGEIEAAIDAAGMREETVIMVSSDHGGVELRHGKATLPEMCRPVLLTGKGVRKGVELTRAGTIYDTGATLAALLGIRPPEAWIGIPYDEAFAR